MKVYILIINLNDVLKIHVYLNLNVIYKEIGKLNRFKKYHLLLRRNHNEFFRCYANVTQVNIIRPN